MVSKKIRVLVVDDSLLFCEVISRGLEADPGIQVVAKANNPFEARDKILELEPDVMLCDVQMPRMNGIDFIRKLIPQYPMPVIVVSSMSDAVFDAMDAGAVDFVCKPDAQRSRSQENFFQELISKVKIASQAKVRMPVSVQPISGGSVKKGVPANLVIAMGASTGGTEALFNILKSLPDTIPGIAIVQHIPPVFSRMFADRLRNQTQLMVKEAETGDMLVPGNVLIAPGDKHMKLVKAGAGFRVEVFEGDKVNGHCPSVDVLFDSVAKEAGANAIGIILTGMGYDGAKGLMAMRRKGARTLGQDEASSVVYGMPKVAWEVGAVERQYSLADIPRALLALVR